MQMAGWLFATLLWLGLILWLGIAAAADWQLRLTGAGNLYTQSAVWSGHFTAANGRFYDASHLYQNRRRPLYLSGELQLFGLALPGRAARQAAEQAGGRLRAGSGTGRSISFCPLPMIMALTVRNSPPARA